jgi:uncharacterized protein YpmS
VVSEEEEKAYVKGGRLSTAQGRATVGAYILDREKEMTYKVMVEKKKVVVEEEAVLLALIIDI